MAARIERVVTSGTFSIDGEDFDVDNNIWLIGAATAPASASAALMWSLCPCVATMATTRRPAMAARIGSWSCSTR